MKTKLYLILAGLFLLVVQVKAQPPNLFNYQGIARDASGNILANQPIGLEFAIHQTTQLGTIVYEEEQSVTTNDFGLFSVSIGSGIVVSGSMSSISWGTNSYYLEVEMDPTGGINYIYMGASQLLSVPYALYALNGGGKGTPYVGGVGIAITDSLISANTSTALWNANKLQGDSISITAPTAGQVLQWNGTAWVSTTTTIVTDSTLTGVGTTADKLGLAQNGATSGQVLEWNGTEWKPTTASGITGGWGLTGNTISTTSGVNFIGTNNAEPLEFVTGGIYAGIMDPQDGNVYFGAAFGQTNAGNFQSGVSTVQNFTGGFNSVGIGTGALGSLAPASNTAGQNYDEVAIGYYALDNFNPNNSTYSSSTAVGGTALRWASTGTPNDAFGYNALGNLYTGTNNVAVGFQSLQNTNGSFNTSVGDNTMSNDYSGTYNTALGNNAGVSIDGLTNATAIGANASVSTSNTVQLGSGASIQFDQALMPFNGSIYDPGTVGYVLQSNGAGAAPTWVVASGGNSWSLTGNAVAYSYNATPTTFLGTTNSNSYGFEFGVNGVEAGRVEANYGSQNTALGWGSLQNGTGTANTAMGINAAQDATGGSFNVAIGWEAFGDYSDGGSENVAVGGGALAGPVGSTNDGGVDYNTAVGYFALVANTAANNTAFGFQAASSGGSSGPATPLTGSPITAIGYETLFNNTSGNDNVALGYESLFNNTSSSSNTALGDNTLYFNSGSQNTAVGTNALNQIGSDGTNAYAETAIGDSALSSDLDGNFNTALGYNANVGTSGLTNATAIGANATVNSSNTVQLGSGCSVQFDQALMPGGNAGNTGQVLQSNGAGTAPTWVTPSSSGVQTVKVHLTAAQVKTLNSSPVTVPVTVPSGYAIQVIGASANLTFNTTAYSSGDLYIQTVGISPGNYQYDVQGFLNSLSNDFAVATAFPGTNEILPATQLQLQADANDTNGGDSPVDVYITYTLFQL